MSNREILVTDVDHFQLFVDAVIETGVSHIALFTAPTWCIPCQRFEPHWLRAQDALPNHIFLKVDMGASPEDTGQHWATAMFGVRGVPTVKLFNDDGIHDLSNRAVVPFVNEVNSYG